MVRMPEAVRSCFPNAPEKCLTCPGLAEAALNLQAHESSAAEVADVSTGLNAVASIAEGIEAAAATELLGTTAEMAVMRSRAVRALGWVLYSSCFDGTQEGRHMKPSKLRWLPGKRRRVVITRWCGSASPMADFLPVVSMEEQGDLN